MEPALGQQGSNRKQIGTTSKLDLSHGSCRWIADLLQTQIVTTTRNRTAKASQHITAPSAPSANSSQQQATASDSYFPAFHARLAAGAAGLSRSPLLAGLGTTEVWPVPTPAAPNGGDVVLKIIPMKDIHSM